MEVTAAETVTEEGEGNPSYDVIYTSANPVPDICERVRPAIVQINTKVEVWDPNTRVSDIYDEGGGAVHVHDAPVSPIVVASSHNHSNSSGRFWGSSAATEKTTVFRWNPKERPCALFISDERPVAPRVRYADGVWTARTATPRVLHRAVYDANGRELCDLRANSPLTDEWKFSLELPAGARLKITDSATGLGD